jgi:hypothetical protein
MAQRIRPTDVTAAFRAAVISARLAGVDTEGWNLRLSDGYMIVTVDEETGMQHRVQLLGGTMRQAFDALHAMRAAWDHVPTVNAMGTWPCWHVEASNGLLYGVAATSKAGAFSMLNARLAADRERHHAVKGEKVGTWETTYANVFCYGDA